MGQNVLTLKPPNIVLIASLQSPWSFVTQGPFVLRISNILTSTKTVSWSKWTAHRLNLLTQSSRQYNSLNSCGAYCHTCGTYTKPRTKLTPYQISLAQQKIEYITYTNLAHLTGYSSRDRESWGQYCQSHKDKHMSTMTKGQLVKLQFSNDTHTYLKKLPLYIPCGNHARGDHN